MYSILELAVTVAFEGAENDKMLKSGGRSFKFNSEVNIQKRISTRKLIRAMVNHEGPTDCATGFIDELFGAESTYARDAFIQSCK